MDDLRSRGLRDLATIVGIFVLFAVLYLLINPITGG
jgi:hypothetical protein